ncbi:Oligopeptide transport system permease protein OppC [Rosistilla oblonga]|uniref:Oligopeptide transport system permease protein OppC n=2 Tax=Rosistilla oblonga TaxID=2527990 RepID=A0A518IXA8_9BACT|nr:ABC transporter permease subunit [Rosistilla oblonga]QDV14091.1 Oligopeptide transport system permease protein OppC [Rosistilla oblonga]QDV57715.1 Oligopeptide transport system permease protein OppC [Rosistilla oblonga]
MADPEIATEQMTDQQREHYRQLLADAQRIQGVSLWQDAWRRLRRRRASMLSLYFLIALAVLAFLTPALPLQSPLDKDLDNRRGMAPNLQSYRMGQRQDLQFTDNSLAAEVARVNESIATLQAERDSATDPEQREALTAKLEQLNTTAHPFSQMWNQLDPLAWQLTRLRVAIFGDWAVPSICGTDDLGRDMLARLFWGARVSLVVGVVATIVSLVIGVSYGATSGYFGGRVDSIMMRIVDVLYSVPFIFVVIFLMTFLSEESIAASLQSFGIDQITIFYIVIGAIYWLTMSRVVRGQVLSLKHEQFVDAARTVGASQQRIIFRHLVPNVLGIVIVYLTLTIPAVMLFEAFLSFLGLGVSPPDVSWGLLVNDGVQAITPLKSRWWLVVFPGSALAGTLFALNFLGDGLRDALDPRMKNQS